MIATEKAPMLFKYTIEYFDNDLDKLVTDSGIVAALSYGWAADCIVKLYGSDSVIGIELYETIACMNEDDLKETFK